MAYHASAYQNWAIGQTVNVGFIRGLLIIAKDPQGWILQSAKGQRYLFVPHCGISKIR